MMNPLTLAQGAESWARSRGYPVPARGSAAWQGMFTAWQRSGMLPNPTGHPLSGYGVTAQGMEFVPFRPTTPTGRPRVRLDLDDEAVLVQQEADDLRSGLAMQAGAPARPPRAPRRPPTRYAVELRPTMSFRTTPDAATALAASTAQKLGGSLVGSEAIFPTSAKREKFMLAMNQATGSGDVARYTRLVNPAASDPVRAWSYALRDPAAHVARDASWPSGRVRLEAIPGVSGYWGVMTDKRPTPAALAEATRDIEWSRRGFLGELARQQRAGAPLTIGGQPLSETTFRWLESVAPQLLRRANRSSLADFGSGEISIGEARLGSGLPASVRPVLAVAAQEFTGGRGFTRGELEREAQGQIRGTHGQTVSAAARVGLSLPELERRGFVVRLGRDLGPSGRPGPVRYAVTKLGEDRALADASVAAEASGEDLAAQEIARREATASAPRGPLSGPVYRPALPVLGTPGHKLPALQKGRMRSAGYRVNPGLAGTPGDPSSVASALAARFGPAGAQRYVNAHIHAANAAHDRRTADYWLTVDELLPPQLADEFGHYPDERLDFSRSPFEPNPHTSPGARDYISRKIGILRHEGYPEAQAAAIAYDYARRAGLHVPPAPNPLTRREARDLLALSDKARREAGAELAPGDTSGHLALAYFGEAQGLARAVGRAGTPADRSLALSREARAHRGIGAALDAGTRYHMGLVGGKSHNPRSKACQAGSHAFDPRTLACTRAGCTARLEEPGQGFMFGYDPAAEADARLRSTSTGQGEMFFGDVRSPNPLSVLLLGNPPGTRPPAGVPGLSAVREHFRGFHGHPVEHWSYVDIDDGKPGLRHRAVSALGFVPNSTYLVPWPSNKRGPRRRSPTVWDHEHIPGHEPLEVYDPVRHTTEKLLDPGTEISDWWRD